MTDPALRALALHVNSCHECACLHDAAAHTGAAAEAAPLDPREGHGVSGLFHHEPGAPCVVCDRHAAAEAAPLDVETVKTALVVLPPPENMDAYAVEVTARLNAALAAVEAAPLARTKHSQHDYNAGRADALAEAAPLDIHKAWADHIMDGIHYCGTCAAEAAPLDVASPLHKAASAFMGHVQAMSCDHAENHAGTHTGCPAALDLAAALRSPDTETAERDWKRGPCAHGNPCRDSDCVEYGRWDTETRETS